MRLDRSQPLVGSGAAPPDPRSERAGNDPWGPPPFSLSLAGVPDPDKALLVRSVVRRIPGKRLACFGRWKGAEVFAKIFFARSGRERHWKRDERGVRAMLEHGIATPAPLYSGATEDGTARALVFERIEGAQNALEAWERADGRESRERFVRRLVEVLARHHTAGLVQKDMHLRNFLIAGDRVYTLDGADVAQHRAPLGRAASLGNLGLLFAQLDPRDDGLAREVYPVYASLRGWGAGKADLAALARAIDRMRERRERQYLRKIFRESTAFAARQDARTMLAWDRKYDSTALRALLADPDRFLESGGALLKDGNTSTVGMATVEGKRFLVKRYNIKGFWHGVKRALRDTRAARSWRNAHLLRLRGIPTAAPVALLERRRGPLRGVAYFVSEYVEGPNCRDYFNSSAVPLEEKQATAREVLALIQALRRARLSHGDMKATNILLTANGPVLVDLDAMHAHRSEAAFERAHAKDVERFLRNWEGEPEVTQLFQGLSG
jgi:tRNA A-37 threonylcarbamoyl transferase component Bud32